MNAPRINDAFKALLKVVRQVAAQHCECRIGTLEDGSYGAVDGLCDACEAKEALRSAENSLGADLGVRS